LTIFPLPAPSPQPPTGPRAPLPLRTSLFGRQQLSLYAFVTAVVVLWNASFFLLSRDDPGASLYDYQGTAGPFSIVASGKDFVVDAPISSVRRGGLVGWTTTLCIHKGVSGLGVTELVKVSPNEEEVVNRVETPIAGDGSRCGPKTLSRLVPLDAPFGRYEIRRQLLLSVAGRPRPPIALQSLHIRVEP
jgi:hypothetical protein